MYFFSKCQLIFLSIKHNPLSLLQISVHCLTKDFTEILRVQAIARADASDILFCYHFFDFPFLPDFSFVSLTYPM